MMNIDMIVEINSLLEGFVSDQDLKCVVFDAEGKHFCTGVEVADHKPDKVDDMIATFNRIFELTEQIEVPIIASVQGYCLGGGMELAIAADVIVAAESAQFGQPEIKVGFFPPYAAMRLPQLVGPARAIEICTTGKFYSAEDARRMVRETGCDAVMIGRGCYGNPWLIRDAIRSIEGEPPLAAPDPEERLKIARQHQALQIEIFGEHKALFEMRKHLCWYARGSIR